MSSQRRYVCYPDGELRRSPNVAPSRKIETEEDGEYKKKKFSFWPLIWILFLALAAYWFYKWLKNMQSVNKGRVIIAVNSSAPRLASNLKIGNNLTKATAVIDHIQALPSSQGKGWINVSNTSQTIDLLALRNASPRLPQIISDTQVPIGQYQKIKFNISKVHVEDSQGVKIVYLPSNVVEFDAPFSVASKKDFVTTIVVDLPLDEGLRDATDEAGKAVKVFAPVINFETRGDAQVGTANKKLQFQKSGNLQHVGTVGMDLHGQTDKGLGIPISAILKIIKGKVVSANGDGQLFDRQNPKYVQNAQNGQNGQNQVRPLVPMDNQVINENDDDSQNMPVSVLGTGNTIDETSGWKALPAFHHGKYNRYQK